MAKANEENLNNTEGENQEEAVKSGGKKRNSTKEEYFVILTIVLKMNPILKNMKKIVVLGNGKLSKNIIGKN